MRYLEGENVKPENTKEAIDLIGKGVVYLRNLDIDKSGRGYFFPKYGVVGDAFRGHIAINGDVISLGDIREMVISCDDQS